MIDAKTWGLIKVIGGLVALWWVWPFAWKTVQGAVAILAILAIIGGAWKAWGKGK